VTLVAVSKTHPAESVLEAVTHGQFHFGENRIEEAEPKIRSVQSQGTSPLVWHMIGHVQSRKARDVIALFDVIHSLDNLKLAERYSRFATELDKSVPILLEINVSGEDSKSGFEAGQWQTNRLQRESLWNDIRTIIKLPGIRVEGLMTMAPIVGDMEEARPVFTALRTLRDALAADIPGAAWTSLSMGMTDDYPVAIEEGATIVRIGRAIFGERG
jgi:pyridoxal phosphate enzyme (YggS family)